MLKNKEGQSYFVQITATYKPFYSQIEEVVKKKRKHISNINLCGFVGAVSKHFLKVLNENKTTEPSTGGDTTIVAFIKSKYTIPFLQRWDGYTKKHLEEWVLPTLLT